MGLSRYYSVVFNMYVKTSLPSTPAYAQMSMRTGPRSMPCDLKSMCAAASLSICWLVMSIWLSGSHQFESQYGFLTAPMCFDSVIDEQRPFGAPNK